MSKGSTEEHSKLIADVKARFGRAPDLIIHHNSRGSMRTVRGMSQFIATPGLGTGSLDLVCGVTVTHQGRTFLQWAELDAKTGNAQPSKEQRMRIAMLRRRGAFACTFRSVEEFGAAIERARRGEQE
jgi:hypothetical protein